MKFNFFKTSDKKKAFNDDLDMSVFVKDIKVNTLEELVEFLMQSECKEFIINVRDGKLEEYDDYRE